MPPNRPFSSSSSRLISRRKFLATLGTVSTAVTAGCSGIPSINDSVGEGDTVEIIIHNETDELAYIAVRIEDKRNNPIFSQVYKLEPRHGDESAGIESRLCPSTVSVFTSEGVSATWDYSPDTGFSCEGQDIGVSLKQDGTFEEWYTC